jgi:hypothetical protein
LAAVPALTHLAIKAKPALLVAVARMCCLPISAWSAGQPRRTVERKPLWGKRRAWCGRKFHVLWSCLRSATQQPCFAAAQRVILCRVIHGRWVGRPARSQQRPRAGPNRQASKCTKSPSFQHRAGRNRLACCRHFCQRGRWQLHSTGPGLTPPSRGRPASGPPLTSNVRAQQCVQ